MTQGLNQSSDTMSNNFLIKKNKKTIDLYILEYINNVVKTNTSICSIT